jgi:hypothetical protein
MEESEIPFDQRDKYLVNALEQDIGNQSDKSDFYANAYIGDVNKGVGQMSNLAAINHETELDNAAVGTLTELYETGRIPQTDYVSKLAVRIGVKPANAWMAIQATKGLSSALATLPQSNKAYNKTIARLKQTQKNKVIAERDEWLRLNKDKGGTESAWLRFKGAGSMSELLDKNISEVLSEDNIGLKDPMIALRELIATARTMKGAGGASLSDINTVESLALSQGISKAIAGGAAYEFVHNLGDNVVGMSNMSVAEQDVFKSEHGQKIRGLLSSPFVTETDKIYLGNMALINPELMKPLLQEKVKFLNNALHEAIASADAMKLEQQLAVLKNELSVYSNFPAMNNMVRANLSQSAQVGLLLSETGASRDTLLQYIAIANTDVDQAALDEKGLSKAKVQAALNKDKRFKHLSLAQQQAVGSIVAKAAYALDGGLFEMFTKTSSTILDLLASEHPNPATQVYSRLPVQSLVQDIGEGMDELRAWDHEHVGALNAGIKHYINTNKELFTRLTGAHSYGKGRRVTGVERNQFAKEHKWSSQDVRVSLVPNHQEGGTGGFLMILTTRGVGGEWNQDTTLNLNQQQIENIRNKGLERVNARKEDAKGIRTFKSNVPDSFRNITEGHGGVQ